MSAESSFKFFGHSNRRFCEKHNVSSPIRAKIPSGITSNRLLEASNVFSLFNDWISEGMLDLHNHTSCCTKSCTTVRKPTEHIVRQREHSEAGAKTKACGKQRKVVVADARSCYFRSPSKAWK